VKNNRAQDADVRHGHHHRTLKQRLMIPTEIRKGWDSQDYDRPTVHIAGTDVSDTESV